MSTTKFPAWIVPRKFSEQEKTIDATCSVDYFTRFSQELHSTKGEIECSVRGTRDNESRTTLLHVKLEGDVELVCEGCLEPFTYHLSRETVLIPAYNDEHMKQDSELGEPVLVEENGLNIKSAVEDELILSLPLIPLYGECEALEAYEVGELPEETIVEQDKNPFDSLKDLKFD